MPCHRSWQYAAALQTFNQGNWFFLLSDASSITEDGDLTTILSTEIVGNDGYTTPSVLYGLPTWDVASQRYLSPAGSLEYTNGGTTTIQYQSQILVCCPSGHTRKVPYPVTQSNFDGAGDTVTYTNHGYVDGDKIVFRVESGTIDTAISTSTSYTVINATVNTFQLSLDELNVLDLNGDGASLDAYIIDRSIDLNKGGLLYQVFPTITSIAPGQAVTVNFTTATDTVL